VVTAARVSAQFAWYENDGLTPPGWTLRVIDSGTTNADGARDIEAVDLDGDGDTDVVTAALLSDQFAWYENDGMTPPGWTLRVIDSGTNADGARDIDAVDLDGDGDTDVVTASRFSDQFAWYENDGATPPGWTVHVIDSGTTNSDSPLSIDAVDFDGDGDTDVVTAAMRSDQFAWYENDGATPPGWTLHVIDSGTTNAHSAIDIDAVDFDGDGDTDVVTAAPDSEQFAWYEMGSHDVRQTAPPVVATVTSPHISFANFPGSPSGWGTVTWNQGNVDGRITVEVLDSAGAATGLSGTTTTTGLGSIDISSLAVTGATSCIRLRATLNDVDGAESGISPQLADWTVTVTP